MRKLTWRNNAEPIAAAGGQLTSVVHTKLSNTNTQLQGIAERMARHVSECRLRFSNR